MLKILIADDHKIIRKGLRQILLEEYPFAYIEEAPNGKILVEKALAGDWNVIISDISMPVMNGLEALKLIKQQLPDIPVLILSIPTEEQYTVSVIRAGASGYLSKDAISEELINAIQHILSGGIYIPSYISGNENGNG